MNKKFLTTLVMMLTFSMLLTLTFGIVQAGKGQEKLDFILHIEGAGAGADVRITDGITHYSNYDWDVIVGPTTYYVEVDGTKYYPVEYLFSGKLALTKSGHTAVHAIETVVFEGGATLVLKVQDHAGRGAADPFVGTITGFGTGSLEGVKIQGTSGGNMIVFERVGTVMGWTTP